MTLLTITFSILRVISGLEVSADPEINCCIRQKGYSNKIPLQNRSASS